jgi:hypothetical protein
MAAILTAAGGVGRVFLTMSPRGAGRIRPGARVSTPASSSSSPTPAPPADSRTTEPSSSFIAENSASCQILQPAQPTRSLEEHVIGCQIRHRPQKPVSKGMRVQISPGAPFVSVASKMTYPVETASAEGLYLKLTRASGFRSIGLSHESFQSAASITCSDLSPSTE